MVLDSVENVHAVFAVDHVDCQAPLAKSSCASNSVQICLIVWIPIFVHRKIKVYHNRYLFHVNPCK